MDWGPPKIVTASPHSQAVRSRSRNCVRKSGPSNTQSNTEARKSCSSHARTVGCVFSPGNATIHRKSPRSNRRRTIQAAASCVPGVRLLMSTTSASTLVVSPSAWSKYESVRTMVPSTDSISWTSAEGVGWGQIIHTRMKVPPSVNFGQVRDLRVPQAHRSRRFLQRRSLGPGAPFARAPVIIPTASGPGQSAIPMVQRPSD